MNPSKNLYPRPAGLGGYLDRAPQFRVGLQEARAARRLEADLQLALPSHLGAAVKAVRANGQRLMITVTSPEAAHIVRLHSGLLLRAYADKGLKFNEISVVMQSKQPSRPAKPARLDPRISPEMLANSDHIQSERLQTSLKRLLKTLGAGDQTT